jgi:hypothetical protein
MPPVNWNKYGIVGEPLERIHAQQTKFPASPPFAQREHAIAAPYSPFLDRLDTTMTTTPQQQQQQQQQRPFDADRRDSAAATPIAPGSSSISEHPMETRRIHERRV